MKDYIEIRWHIDDVRAVAQDEFDMELSDGDCLEILESVKKSHDASLGINWTVIGAAIQNFKPKPKKYYVVKQEFSSIVIEADSKDQAYKKTYGIPDLEWEWESDDIIEVKEMEE
jgi:hypothetical protein|tara:strand:+ start:187 stop:531 length:345 start_codon:yes stop_codon:yes gene_type:complete